MMMQSQRWRSKNCESTQSILSENIINHTHDQCMVPRRAEMMFPSISSINVLQNPLQDDGLAHLVGAIEASPIKSIAGLSDFQTVFDLFGQGLVPFDLEILSADL
eukprot:SAG31_NODE_6405_length_2031_cov_1.337992_3_plen_104_part_01